MPRYSIAPVNKAGVNTANTVMWQILAGGTRRLYVREVGLFVNVAPTTAPSYVLARSTAVGTASTTFTPVAHDPSDPATGALLHTAWSAAPTFTTAGPFMRNMGLPITAGNGVIWNFADEPLVIAASAGLCVANLNATGATLGSFGVYAVYDE